MSCDWAIRADCCSYNRSQILLSTNLAYIVFFGKTDVIGYAKSQGSTKLTVTGQFVQTVSAWVCP